MAPAALAVVGETSEPMVVEQVVLLPVDQIDDSGRLRPVDLIWAAALGRIMTADGQDEPISVCRLPGQAGWKLIVGGHRLAGAQSGQPRNQPDPHPAGRLRHHHPVAGAGTAWAFLRERRRTTVKLPE